MTWAAGVLPVAVAPDGRVMVLLSKDVSWKGGGWSDFAGGGETYDDSPQHTAVRELREESSGVLAMSPDDLRDALTLLDRTPSGKQLHRFVVRRAFDAEVPARFRPNDEKTDMRWFPLDNLPHDTRRVFHRQMVRDAEAIRAYVKQSTPAW